MSSVYIITNHQYIMKSNDSRSQWTDNEEKTYIKLKNIKTLVKYTVQTQKK